MSICLTRGLGKVAISCRRVLVHSVMDLGLGGCAISSLHVFVDGLMVVKRA